MPARLPEAADGRTSSGSVPVPPLPPGLRASGPPGLRHHGISSRSTSPRCRGGSRHEVFVEQVVGEEDLYQGRGAVCVRHAR